MPAPADPTPEYYKAAVGGSKEAYNLLREYALQAGAHGLVADVEAVAVAEVHARMAYAIGDEGERGNLAAVLLLRAHQRSQEADGGRFYREEAAHHLRVLADGGDAQAAATLEGQGFGAVWESEPGQEALQEQRDAAWSAAANGDTAVLVSLSEASLSIDPERLECLVHAEQYARLGSYAGADAACLQLARVLLYRRDHEARHNNPARMVEVETEACTLLIDLWTAGSGEAAVLLAAFCEELPMFEVSLIAASLPEILFFVQPQGVA